MYESIKYELLMRHKWDIEELVLSVLVVMYHEDPGSHLDSSRHPCPPKYSATIRASTEEQLLQMQYANKQPASLAMWLLMCISLIVQLEKMAWSWYTCSWNVHTFLYNCTMRETHTKMYRLHLFLIMLIPYYLMSLDLGAYEESVCKRV